MTPSEYSADVILDPAIAAAARRTRWKRFQTVEVPFLRLIGFAFNAIAVMVQNHFVLHSLTVHTAVVVTSVLIGYALAAWLVLYLWWARVESFDLGDLFMVTDVLALMFVVYVSGADRSLLWVVFVARVADQVAMTFRRALVYAHVCTMAYASIIFYVALVQHRDVDWPIAACKIAFLYILSVYISLTARTAEVRRRKFSQARHLAEAAVRDADLRRRALEDALAKLSTADRTKSEFLANVSHEIRTPLNSVVGTTELLLDTPLSRDQREMIGLVRDSADSLTHIVSDILDLSRMEAQRLSLEAIPIRVRDLVGSTVRMFAARAHQKHLELVCHIAHDVPDILIGDPLRLRQVLTNLLSNAVKFTAAGEIAVRVEADERVESRVLLRCSVRDTGIGIPKSRHAAVFEAFTQADGSSTRNYGGTGLGLTIVAKLVALMGGRIWLESDEGAGSTFTFVLWLQVLPAGDDVPPPWGDRPMAILVAAGPRIARDAIIELVRSWRGAPARIIEAPAGRLALSALQTARHDGHPVDIVLADARLPGMNGFDLAAEIAASPGLARHTIVMLRTNERTTGASRAHQVGAGYLVAPVTRDALGVAILEAMAPASDAPAPSPGPRQTRRPLRVLVVEDHVVNQAIALAALRKWGHVVAAAADGSEAVAKVASEHYDAVLMDLQMPVLDGLQATERIRSMEAADAARPRVAIFAMTARAMDEDRDRCDAAGMDAYLSKPVNQQQLFDLLESVGARTLDADTREEASALSPFIGDEALARHVADLFLRTTPGQMDRLRAALSARDAPAVQSLAHSLRGAMANFGGTSLVAAESLEHRAETAAIDAAREAFDALERDIQGLEARLRRFLAQRDARS